MDSAAKRRDPEEITEALLQVATYAGYPAALDALGVLEGVVQAAEAARREGPSVGATQARSPELRRSGAEDARSTASFLR